MTATINLSLNVPRTYDMALLKEQLTEYAKKLIAIAPAKERIVPYTIEELHARIDRAEADVAAGRVMSRDEASRRMKDYIAQYA